MRLIRTQKIIGVRNRDGKHVFMNVYPVRSRVSILKSSFRVRQIARTKEEKTLQNSQLQRERVLAPADWAPPLSTSADSLLKN